MRRFPHFTYRFPAGLHIDQRQVRRVEDGKDQHDPQQRGEAGEWAESCPHPDRDGGEKIDDCDAANACPQAELGKEEKASKQRTGHRAGGVQRRESSDHRAGRRV
jgi:hypothetical protein